MQNNAKKYTNDFLKSITAGVMIGIAGYTFLHCENIYIGAVLFCIGLITVCFYQLNLYTGMVGNIIDVANKNEYTLQLIIALVGNIIGCYFISKMPLSIAATEKLYLIIEVKTTTFTWSKPFLCGCFMYLAVDIYKRRQSIIGIFLCVASFIIANLDHSIANVYYFFLQSETSIWVLIPAYIIGNGIGSCFMNVALHLGKQEKKEYKDIVLRKKESK